MLALASRPMQEERKHHAKRAKLFEAKLRGETRVAAKNKEVFTEERRGIRRGERERWLAKPSGRAVGVEQWEAAVGASAGDGFARVDRGGVASKAAEGRAPSVGAVLSDKMTRSGEGTPGDGWRASDAGRRGSRRRGGQMGSAVGSLDGQGGHGER